MGNLEALPFQWDNQWSYRVLNHGDGMTRGQTSVLDTGRGVKLIFRNFGTENGFEPYMENVFPEGGSLGAFVITGAFGSRVFKTKDSQIHVPGEFFWGNYPGMDCGSRYVQGHRTRVVYLLVSREYWDRLINPYEEGIRGDHPLPMMWSGRREGFLRYNGLDPRIAVTMGQMVSTDYEDPWQQFWFEGWMVHLMSGFLKGMDRDQDRDFSGLSPQGQARIRYGWDLIRTDLKNPPDMDRLVSELGLSESSIRRLFRKEFGISMTQALFQNRMEVAEFLIGGKICSIFEAACEVGYSNPAAFSAAFKRFRGYSPRDIPPVKSSFFF